MANRSNLTRQEAADELRLSTKTIDRLRDSGELESFLLGTRSLRIVAASLAAYESRQRQRCGPLKEALVFATDAHATQKRMGADVPYVSHLMAVSAFAIEDWRKRGRGYRCVSPRCDRDQPFAGAWVHRADRPLFRGDSVLLRHWIGDPPSADP
jgi:hypothetical protein